MIILLTSLLLAACSQFEPELNNEEIVYTDVEYSEDGNTVTIYLDGSAPVPASRALSKNLAITAHDYFEVTFYYRGTTGTASTADYIIGRGKWELGEDAGVTVYRTQAGINYGVPLGSIGHTGGTGTTVAAGIVTIPDGTYGFTYTDGVSVTGITMGANTGTALLIAGKKSDKTILAVGALTNAVKNDGTSSRVTTGPAANQGIWISSDTKSVSFELNALKAGAFNMPIAESSFYTNANSDNTTSASVTSGNTLNTEINIGARTFPLFRFRVAASATDGQGRRAHYVIRTHSSINGLATYNPTSTSDHAPAFNFYRRGIIQATDGAAYTIDGVTYQKAQKIRPQYTQPNTATPTTSYDAAYHYNSYYETNLPPTSPTAALNSAGETAVILRTDNQGNGTGTALFMNPVRFYPVHTYATQGEIFAITFQIPVFAFSTEGNPVMWFIRPGYDKYIYELDDGSYGNGGAVLCGVGDFVSATPTWYLKISNPPAKTYYNGAGGATGYQFDTTEISVQFMGSSQVIDSNLSPFSMTPAYYLDVNKDGIPQPGELIAPPTDIRTILGNPFTDQELTVIVRYTYTGTPASGAPTGDYYATFVINVSNLNVNFSTIAEERRFILSTENDLQQALNYMNGKNGPFLWVLTRSFDFLYGRTVNNIAGDTTLVITALKPGLTLGRANTGAFLTFLTGNVLVFFGKWPFNTPIFVGGEILHDEAYNINAGGSYAGGGGATGAMFRQGGATVWTVQIGPEMTLLGGTLND